MTNGVDMAELEKILLTIRQAIVFAATWDADVPWDTLGFLKGVYLGATQNLPKGSMIE